MKNSIIIVDDDPIIRMDIREMLEEEGYYVVGVANNGQEAIDLVSRFKPDLVIMDVKMPVLNGIKASNVIRNMTDASVLLLTAYSQRELVKDASMAGVAAYLVKPVSEEDLIPAVEIALSQKKKIDSLKNDLLNLQQSMEDRKLVEKAKGSVMKAFGLDEEEAYQKIRSISMSKQMPLPQLASVILKEGCDQLSVLLGSRKG